MAAPYVDLGRTFRAFGSSSEPALAARLLDAKGGLHTWNDLLAMPRVMLLAPASSGKTEEFRERARALRDAGRAAFFLPMRQLAVAELNVVVQPDHERLQQWLKSGGQAWFFLDSIDEARVARHDVWLVWKKLALQLGEGLGCAHILVSGRPEAGWEQDRDEFVRVLPLSRLEATTSTSATPAPVNSDAALLEPLRHQNAVVPSSPRPSSRGARAESSATALPVLEIVPLADEQQRELARAAGVTDTEAFLSRMRAFGHGWVACRRPHFAR